MRSSQPSEGLSVHEMPKITRVRKLKNECQPRTNSGKSGLSQANQTKNFSLMPGPA